jgi:arylsulfatase A-like enzyme
VSLLDIYPTLVQLAGLDMPKHIDGLSLVPLIADPGAARDEPAITVWDYGNVSIRDDHFRFTQYFDGSQELYNHEEDPNEWNNIVNDPASEEVKQSLSSYLPANPAPSAFP